MKTILKIILLCGIIQVSCDKENINPTLEDFCSVAPDGWECEINWTQSVTKNIHL